MTLWEKIVQEYPDLTNADFDLITGSIKLKDDSDGLGAYIVKWEYSKPIPKGLKIGK